MSEVPVPPMFFFLPPIDMESVIAVARVVNVFHNKEDTVDVAFLSPQGLCFYSLYIEHTKTCRNHTAKIQIST